MAKKKIARVVLKDQRDPAGELRKLEAYVEDTGDLVMGGYDLGDKFDNWI
ncbi:MAG: hypothetical protein KJP17_09660 [Gammaproteobacteria bacterium]|nr:hypothetical protein [Gammaproteobacteria bacterium]